jgi:hypothetical protein
MVYVPEDADVTLGTNVIATIFIVEGTLNLGGYELTLTSADFPVPEFGMDFQPLMVMGDGIFNADGGTVIFEGDGATTILAADYHNLTINGNGPFAPSDNMTITGDFILSAGTFNVGDHELAVGGNLEVNSGTLDASSALADVFITGDLTISGGTFLAPSDTPNPAALSFTVGGDFEISDGTFTNPSLFTLTGSGVTFTDSRVSIVDVGIIYFPAGSSATLGSSVKSTLVSVVGTLNLGVLNILTLTGGDYGPWYPLFVPPGMGTFNADSGTVIFEGTGPSTIFAGTYFNVTFNNASGTFTSVGDTTVTGVLNVAAGELKLSSYTWILTGNDTPLVVTGTFTPGTSMLLYAGTGAINIAATTYYDLAIIGTGTFTQAGVVSVTNDFLMLSGTYNQNGHLTIGESFSLRGGVFTSSTAATFSAGSFVINDSWANNDVNAIAIDGSGNVYIGGNFTSVGGVANTKYIAMWNGMVWSALGTGMDAAVQALAVDGSDNLYAGGYFTSAGGVENTGYIAMWDGAAWNAVGDGRVNGPVNAIAVSGTDVYVGGGFNFLDIIGAGINNIGRWDSDASAWWAVGTGTNGYVAAIAVYDTSVYIGGNFTTAGDNPANYAAMWNGALWSGINSTLTNTVNAIAIDSSNPANVLVYFGGNFTMAEGAPADYLARYRVVGGGWKSIPPDGSSAQVDGPVNALAVSGISLYIGGSFSSAGGSPAANIVKWTPGVAPIGPR